MGLDLPGCSTTVATAALARSRPFPSLQAILLVKGLNRVRIMAFFLPAIKMIHHEHRPVRQMPKVSISRLTQRLKQNPVCRHRNFPPALADCTSYQIYMIHTLLLYLETLSIKEQDVPSELQPLA